MMMQSNKANPLVRHKSFLASRHSVAFPVQSTATTTVHINTANNAMIGVVSTCPTPITICIATNKSAKNNVCLWMKSKPSYISSRNQLCCRRFHQTPSSTSNTFSSSARSKSTAVNDSNNYSVTTTVPVRKIKTKSGDGGCDSTLLNAPRSRGRDDDVLSRYPNFYSAGGVLRGLDYVGTVTFALTGCITAAQSGLDVVGCTLVGMVTAVGGGTIRDAIILSRRPFWTSETEYVWMSMFTALFTVFAWPYVLEYRRDEQIKRRSTTNSNRKNSVSSLQDTGEEDNEDHDDEFVNNAVNLAAAVVLQSATDGNHNQERQQQQTPDPPDDPFKFDYDEVAAVLDTLDAVGLSAFCIIGAQNGIRAGMPMVVSAICGMATSTFGGMTRDVLCARPVRIVHSNVEVYSTPALAGAIVYLWLYSYASKNATSLVRLGAAFSVCMGSRYMVGKYDVKLHTWDTQQDGLGVAVRKRRKQK